MQDTILYIISQSFEHYAFHIGFAVFFVTLILSNAWLLARDPEYFNEFSHEDNWSDFLVSFIFSFFVGLLWFVVIFCVILFICCIPLYYVVKHLSTYLVKRFA